MMRIRDRLLRNHRKSNDQSDKELYKKFRNRVSKSLRESKANFFYNYFQQNRNNMKELWSGIKSVISIKKSSNTNIINKLKDSYDNITSDPAVIANFFNKFLSMFLIISLEIYQDLQNRLWISWEIKLRVPFSLPLQSLMKYQI